MPSSFLRRVDARASLAGATALAVLLGSIIVVTSTQVQAASPLGESAVFVAEDQPAARLELTAAVTVPLLQPTDAELTVRVERANSDASKRGSGTLEVFVSPNRVRTLEELDSRLAATSIPEDVDVTLASEQVAAVDRDTRVVNELRLETSTLKLPAVDGAGVYLLYVMLAEKDGQKIVTTAPFVWQGTGTQSPTQLATVLPLVLPTEVDGLASASQIGAFTAADGYLRENLEAAITAGSTLAIDPTVIASIRALGDRAPASAVDFLTQLESTGLPSFALQFGDADLSAQAALGLSQPLAPTGFGFTGSDLAAAELTAFDYSLNSVAWPGANSVSERTAAKIAGYGFQTLLLDSTNLARSDSVGATLASTGGTVVALSDRLNARASATLTGASRTLRERASSTLVSELALMNQTGSPGQGVALGIDRVAASARSVQTLAEQLSALPWVEQTPLPALLASASASSTELTEAAPEPSRLDALRNALVAEPTIAEYSAVLVRPENLTELQRMRILEFFSAGLAAQPAVFKTVANEFFTRDERTLHAVHITPTRSTNMVGTESNLPVQITNNLPFTARVNTDTSAINASLQVLESQLSGIDVRKNSSVNITVPVSSRVSTGSSGLSVRLYAQNGLLVDEQLLAVQIRSGFETAALIVLGMLLTAFFGFGIWRSVRNRSTPQVSRRAVDREP